MKVKFREAWRPYAASVLAKHVNDWFDAEGAYPYMIEAVAVKKDKMGDIPAVTHLDGTCRIQTVTHDQALNSFCELLTCFGSLTGVPLLLNTSLNSSGEPIYGYATQARKLLSAGCLDALCIGDDLVFRE